MKKRTRRLIHPRTPRTRSASSSFEAPWARSRGSASRSTGGARANPSRRGGLVIRKGETMKSNVTHTTEGEMSKIIEGSQAVPPRYRVLGLLVVALAVAVAVGGATSRSAKAVLDPTLPNTVQQWNKVAEDTVVDVRGVPGRGRGLHGLHVGGCVRRGRRHSGRLRAVRARQSAAPAGASVDAAVVEAAYRTLSAYFPSSCNPTNAACMALGASLLTDYNVAMALIPSGHRQDERNDCRDSRPRGIIALRTGDGRMTPIGTSSSFEKKNPGAGVWRLTRPA